MIWDFYETEIEMGELVSVIMSTYNEKRTELEQSINSILTQSYKDIEFIVVNDNPDNEMIREVLDQYEKEGILIIHNERNLGITESLNRALRQARGKYIARMDADDISYSSRIQNQVEYIKENQLDMIGTYVQIINQDGQKGQVVKLETNCKKICRKLSRGNQLVHPSWLGKKELFDQLGGYRSIPLCEDYDFLLRAKKQGAQMGNLPFVELEYRIRENSISNENAAKQMAMALYISNHASRMSEEKLIQYFESYKFGKKEKQCEKYLRASNSPEYTEKIKLLFSKVFYQKLIRAILYSTL